MKMIKLTDARREALEWAAIILENRERESTSFKELFNEMKNRILDILKENSE